MGAGSDASWKGASGRVYQADPTEPVREGPRRRVTPVVATGDPPRPGGPAAGRRLALVEDNGLSEAAHLSMAREREALRRLSDLPTASPGPRLHDQVDGGAVITDWCPVELEGWWSRSAAEPDGFRHLCLAMADVCRRLADWRAACRTDPALERAAPRIRPRSVLRTDDRRWVLSDFGAEDMLGPADADPDGGTEVMTTTSAYAAPEDIFLATTEQPMARHTWAIGATFLALVRLRAHQRPGTDGRAVELPVGGTDSVHFRSHRASLLEDLHSRKPGLFVDRPLDPRQFLYPDRLPDRDRRQVSDALAGVFGAPQEVMEGQLAKEILRILDSALSIDPARRYLDPLVLAGDFEALAKRFRQMRASVAAARFEAAPGDDDRTQILTEDPPTEEELPPVEVEPDAVSEPSPDDGRPEPVSSEAATAEETPAPPLPEDELSDGIATVVSPVDAAPPAPVARAVAPAPQPPPAALPRWVPLGFAALTLSQLATLVLVGVLWTRQAPIGALSPSDTVRALEGLDLPEAPPTEGAALPERDPAIDAPAEPLDAEGEPPPEPVAPPDTGTAPAGAADDLPPAVPADEPSPLPADRQDLGPDRADAPPVQSAARTAPAREATSGAPSASSDASAAPPPAPGRAEPAPEPPAATEQAGGSGSLTVAGAEAYLVGADGRHGVGVVPAGSYEVWIREEGGDGWLKATTAKVAAGQQAEVRCGFGQCRQVK